MGIGSDIRTGQIPVFVRSCSLPPASFLIVADDELIMVSVTVNVTGRPPAFARGFPISVEVPNDGKVADIKAAIHAKFPKVRPRDDARL